MIDTSFLKTRKVAYLSLGCKLNFAETSSIGRIMSDAGYRKIKPGETPDVCIINTCSVTDTADKKSRQAINRLIKKYPDSKIVVTGCYAQLKPGEISHIPGVDLILGANEKFDIPGHLEEIQKGMPPTVLTSKLSDIKKFKPSFSRDDRTRYFLKVQDGCDYYCTYCTIPMARGRSRNGSISEMVEMACQIAAEGGREIVLTGVNIGDYGKTTGESFIDLLKALDKVEGIERFRISSIEPNLLTHEIIDFVVSSKKIAPHFHIPLQAGCDELLSLMQRKYNTALFRDRIEYIKSKLPHAFIGIDVIVGSRGETQELFEKEFEFINSLDFSQLHIFSYSERPGTKALSIDHVVSSVDKKARHIKLQDISDRMWNDFYNRFIGTTSYVLFEHSVSDGMMHGFTDNYIRVEALYDKDLINKIVKVKLGGFNTDRSALKSEIL